MLIAELMSCFAGIKSFQSSLGAFRVFHRIMITAEMFTQSYINIKAQNYYQDNQDNQDNSKLLQLKQGPAEKRKKERKLFM